MVKTIVTAVLWFMSGWTLGNVIATVADLPWVVVPTVATATVGVFARLVAPRIHRPAS